MLHVRRRSPPKPHQRLFRRTPEARKQRLAIEREEDYRNLNEQAQRLFDSGKHDELFDATMPMIRGRARKLQWAFEFDDSTLDDIVQVGRNGLWDAIGTYDGRTEFRAYAMLFARRRMWGEIRRLNGQKRRGFRKLTHEQTRQEPNASHSERLADTEAIGVVMEMLQWLPDDWQEIAMLRASGERQCLVADHMGYSQSSVHRIYKKVIEHLEEMARPQFLGAWTPFPCVMGDVWEAFQFASPEEPARLTKMIECEHCGELFRPDNANQKSCTMNCRKKFYEAAKRRRLRQL